MSADKGKGKGKAIGSENTANPGKDDDSSMLSRITASASGLTRDVFSAPNGSDSSIAALANSGKGQSSSASGSGTSAWTASSKRAHPISVTPSGQATIKPGHTEDHVKKTEEEFEAFLNGVDVFSPSEPSGTIGADAYKDIGATWGEAWARAQTIDTPEFNSPDPASRTVTEQEAQDGQEVLDLLLSPGWISKEFEEPAEDEAPEDYDWGLSEDQISQIRLMTRHLAAPDPHGSIAIDHSLNLIPNLDMEGRVQWIEQWEDVLTRYADEVWGGLLPLVKEARQEVEEIRKDDTASEKPTAVRRLEAILGHLQQR